MVYYHFGIFPFLLSIEVQQEKIAKLQTKQTVAVSPPIPPQGDQFPGNECAVNFVLYDSSTSSS